MSLELIINTSRIALGVTLIATALLRMFPSANSAGAIRRWLTQADQSTAVAIAEEPDWRLLAAYQRMQASRGFGALAERFIGTFVMVAATSWPLQLLPSGVPRLAIYGATVALTVAASHWYERRRNRPSMLRMLAELRAEQAVTPAMDAGR